MMQDVGLVDGEHAAVRIIHQGHRVPRERRHSQLPLAHSVVRHTEGAIGHGYLH